MSLLRFLLRPIGYLLFAISLAALSGAAKLLGERHELGFFSGRLAGMLWRYPELTRRGVQVAWLAWATLFAIAVSPIDPLATRWDEFVLGAIALLAVWRWLAVGRRAEH